MNILTNQSLKSYNSFWIDALAKELVFLENDSDYTKFSKLSWNNIILGSGSNVLLLSNTYDHVGIMTNNSDPVVIDENNERVIIESKAGYKRDTFVQWTLNHGYYGLENMGLIPWTIWAWTLGNIGAYGKEICEFIHEVDYIDLWTWEIRTLCNDQCQYSYRWSIFKSMTSFIIASVRFIFYKDTHELNAHYPDIQKYLTDHNIKPEDLTAKQLYQIICEIRTSKMPSRDEWWTAGSFWKNPIINTSDLERIKIIDPDIKYFAYGNNFKLAAGWLLENLWYKWNIIRMPSWWSVWCYKNQALLVVNNGCTGLEVDEFARGCEKAVWDYYGVKLEREVIGI